jgi:hypothetical protein
MTCPLPMEACACGRLNAGLRVALSRSNSCGTEIANNWGSSSLKPNGASKLKQWLLPPQACHWNGSLEWNSRLSSLSLSGRNLTASDKVETYLAACSSYFNPLARAGWILEELSLAAGVAMIEDLNHWTAPANNSSMNRTSVWAQTHSFRAIQKGNLPYHWSDGLAISSIGMDL